MPAPYSYDLHSKAVAAVKRGEKKVEVSHFFKISRNTLDLWLKKERKRNTTRKGKPACRSRNSTENSGLKKVLKG